jgi:hypothetical protein
VAQIGHQANIYLTFGWRPAAASAVVVSRQIEIDHIIKSHKMVPVHFP